MFKHKLTWIKYVPWLNFSSSFEFSGTVIRIVQADSVVAVVPRPCMLCAHAMAYISMHACICMHARSPIEL
jgi:hypothetical protein